LDPSALALLVYRNERTLDDLYQTDEILSFFVLFHFIATFSWTRLERGWYDYYVPLWTTTGLKAERNRPFLLNVSSTSDVVTDDDKNFETGIVRISDFLEDMQ
jgi:hypothetical protein